MLKRNSPYNNEFALLYQVMFYGYNNINVGRELIV